ncbi:MAG TPA: beta-propeller fold lactonase family protein, partial [Verrucomicrobiales bacterium]|nr:beta-propeller fold lactonase family protein [Verrucomicrobiales bacterium]
RGKTPRGFVVSPSGKWLLAAGQQSGTVTVFSIDETTGALTYNDSGIKVGSPVCVRFLPQP